MSLHRFPLLLALGSVYAWALAHVLYHVSVFVGHLAVTLL